MSEQHFHSHKEITSNERADLMNQAATELGGVAIAFKHRAGESYHGARGRTGTVPEGHVQLHVSGTFDKQGTGPFYNRVRQLEQEHLRKAA